MTRDQAGRRQRNVDHRANGGWRPAPAPDEKGSKGATKTQQAHEQHISSADDVVKRANESFDKALATSMASIVEKCEATAATCRSLLEQNATMRDEDVQLRKKLCKHVSNKARLVEEEIERLLLEVSRHQGSHPPIHSPSPLPATMNAKKKTKGRVKTREPVNAQSEVHIAQRAGPNKGLRRKEQGPVA